MLTRKALRDLLATEHSKRIRTDVDAVSANALVECLSISPWTSPWAWRARVVNGLVQCLWTSMCSIRLRDGRMVNGLRGHRLVHSLVNTLLITEGTGKSRALHKVVARRLGKRVVGGEVLSRAVLRDLMATAHSKHMILGQIMILGKDVRSAPMQWKYQQKLLDSP